MSLNQSMTLPRLSVRFQKALSARGESQDQCLENIWSQTAHMSLESSMAKTTEYRSWSKRIFMKTRISVKKR